MNKHAEFFLQIILIVTLAVHSAGAETVIRINEDLEPKTAEEVQDMVQAATEEYYQDEELAWEKNEEIMHLGDEDYLLTWQGNAMRFKMEKRGEANENGRYPLYLALHGGGESPAEDNDSQWYAMFSYYREAVENGIYIACRGITDTWDLHFRPESYPLYDRLIQDMILLYDADPNQVYLLGFSAGGDGVYQIAARMPDRFAAANMSSGHPNGISLRNLMNCPFSIQVGVRDYYSESAMRCIRAAEFEQVLNDYHDLMGYGYEHQVLVHVPAGHNFNDFTDFSRAEEDSGDMTGESGEEVLADPAAYADPAITGPMLDRFVEAFRSAMTNPDLIGDDIRAVIEEEIAEAMESNPEYAEYLALQDPAEREQLISEMLNGPSAAISAEEAISEMSYLSAGAIPSFDDEIRKIITEEFQLATIRHVNSSAVHYVSGFIRNPAPEMIVWDLATRAPSREITSFYWLRADPSLTQGTIQAMADGENGMTVAAENVEGDFSILIHPALFDVSRPIHITTPEGDFEVQVNPSEETLRESMRETGDPSLAWVAEIPYSMLHE